MFWRKQREEATRESGPVEVAKAADPSEEAIDALGAVIRAFAKHAFDVGETSAKTVERTLEQWAQHVLVFAPPPGAEAPTDATPRRNFGALVRAITEHRKAEREYVTSAIAELRDTVWAFVSTLTRSLGADEAADARLKERVERLKAAVASDSHAALRAEANMTATVLADVVTQREERVKRQAQELSRSLRSLKEQLDQANREGALDPLTRIYNRKTLEEVLKRSASLATLTREPCSLLMVDIDHFKQVNDRFGHPAGDAVLKEVANALVRCFPRRGDVVARYGGEEFAVVLNGSGEKETTALAERPLAVIRLLAVKHGAQSVQVTVSVGYATVRPGEPVEAWVERADRALYAAKQGGRNRAVAASLEPPKPTAKTSQPSAKPVS